MTRAITISVIFLMMLAACARAQDEAVTQVASQPWLYQDLQVGHETPGLVVTPVNQILTPEGIQVPLDGLRPQVVALSPDQRLLVTSGKTSSLIVIDPATGKILQSVELPSLQQTRPIEPVSENILKPDQRAQVSYTGLIFSPDGQNLFLSDVNGSIKVFRVHEGKIYSSHSIILPPADAPRRSEEIPSGLAIAADGKTLYVCGNLSNQLLEINLEKGETTRVFPVGVAPYDVVLADGVAIVSNWGGRRAEPGDLTGPAGRGTVVRVDSERHIAAEGSVTFIDLNSGQVLAEILTGLHASDLEISPDRRFVVCANAGSDNLSVIDIAKRTIIDTIWAKPNPSELFGATPNAITISPDGNKLYLANGTHNSIAVIEVDFDEPGEHEFEGLIPVGWFPGALVLDSQRNQLCVANIKGLPMSPKARDGTEGFNSHHYSGSLSIVPIPDKSRLQGLTLIAARNMSEPAIAQALQPPRENQLSRPVPERIGEPSQIKHVVYIIKENRTYDQVFGALEEGNGHSQLCIFGKDITPNFHKLAAEFGLLDNTYCAGILSADGHQWSTTAISTDYMEKSFAGFPRSYPDGMDIDDVDALAYSPAGFIWDNAKSHGVTMRNYGEFMIPEVRWRDASRRGT
ncbi:MAG: beta-propeller fold lactonase family protein, partial [Planctomycetales bacterium]|nr:beta-propeller fold lactonase family protein [Planctomycetales bacterium]